MIVSCMRDEWDIDEQENMVSTVNELDWRFICFFLLADLRAYKTIIL